MNIDINILVDTLYLDFSKAFNKIPHSRLLLKLKDHVIEGNIYNLIKC